MIHRPTEYCRNCCCHRPVRADDSDGTHVVLCMVCDEVIVQRSGSPGGQQETARAERHALPASAAPEAEPTSERPASKEFGAQWFARWRREEAHAS